MQSHGGWESDAFAEARIEALRQADYDGDALIRLSALRCWMPEDHVLRFIKSRTHARQDRVPS
jgi:hypothetical protein